MRQSLCQFGEGNKKSQKKTIDAEMLKMPAFFSKSSMNMRHVSDFDALYSVKSQTKRHDLVPLTGSQFTR
jgi:hypothetical protein